MRKHISVTFLVLALQFSQVFGSYCELAIDSTCPENLVDDVWNTKHVSTNLKKWILSLNNHDGDKKIRIQMTGLHLFFDTPHFKNNKGTAFRWITRADCQDGSVFGNAWMVPKLYSRYNFHNGFLYGAVDEEGWFNGSNISWIYPDMKTVLHGYFEDGVMREARATRIIAERCNRGIKEIKVAEPAKDGPIYNFHKINAIRINDKPTLMDPYERKTIYIQDSPVATGDGAFAKRDIKSGELVCYYTGTLHDKNGVFFDNQTVTEQAEVHKNLMHYFLDGESWMNVEKPYWSIAKYRATLGHKLNHSFKPNTYFCHGYHPRFGYVVPICASKDIKRGEELLVHYQYSKDEGNSVPKWYADLYKQQVGEDWPTPTF